MHHQGFHNASPTSQSETRHHATSPWNQISQIIEKDSSAWTQIWQARWEISVGKRGLTVGAMMPTVRDDNDKIENDEI